MHNETNAQLLQQCQRLLFQISKRPGSTKLLMLARDALQIYANYKANRTSKLRRKVDSTNHFDEPSLPETSVYNSSEALLYIEDNRVT